MDTSKEVRRRHYRAIYELFWSENARIHLKDIASRLRVNPRTARRRVEEAFSQGYVTGPQLRKRSYANMKEYVCFVNCENPTEAYLDLSQDAAVVYHARLAGFASLWVSSTRKVTIDGTPVIKGLRSDYHVSFAPYRSWEKAIEVMRGKIESFHPECYEPTSHISSHWDETITWDEEDEKLFRYFESDLRRIFVPVMKKHLISTGKIYQFLERLPQCCTVTTSFFPEGISAYDPYLFVFGTEYEDFIVDLFSQMPTSAFFFKVSDMLFLHAHVKKDLMRCEDLGAPSIRQLPIPGLISELLKKGIIESEEHAVVEYHWTKSL
ncbi:MAG: winged helix-turn-helix domain-containing protein [Theionarchaea archaeon]|nr:winged helix-turn-helix domain-containing protein [Theionarchaea archaeon]MBU7021270.1 winged helix-turn-helix domain-containing protein [Theionarchaea archaeon]MBU7036051.1 winged helix-turn-helix domain-containing protein [Theionarchaea archaeon]MBU7039761.1 winged helix-turn-helix domain-containing protein [Theionarchaea archaeon]